MTINATHHPSLHPITDITLPEKDQKRIASKVLINQCCTDQGLISQNLASMLGLLTTKATLAPSPPKLCILKVENARLPYLSTNRPLSLGSQHPESHHGQWTTLLGWSQSWESSWVTLPDQRWHWSSKPRCHSFSKHGHGQKGYPRNLNPKVRLKDINMGGPKLWGVLR